MSIIDDGVEFETIWDGSHQGQNRDLFRWVEADLPKPAPERPIAHGKVWNVLEVRRCEECGEPVMVNTRVGKAERLTRRFCGRRCAKVSDHRERKASQVAA